MVGEEEDVRERFRAVEKGSRAAGKVLRTGKEPAARVRPFGRVRQQSCG